MEYIPDAGCASYTLSPRHHSGGSNTSGGEINAKNGHKFGYPPSSMQANHVAPLSMNVHGVRLNPERGGDQNGPDARTSAQINGCHDEYSGNIKAWIIRESNPGLVIRL